MRITYHFSDEDVAIDVPKEWSDVLIELDRQEYNTNHAETRRHVSLQAYCNDDALLPSDDDVEAAVLWTDDMRKLRNAMDKLSERQKSLIYRVFFLHRSYVEVAREDGIHPVSAREATLRALAGLKKDLS